MSLLPNERSQQNCAPTHNEISVPIGKRSTRLMAAAAGSLLSWSMACQSAHSIGDTRPSNSSRTFALSSFPSTYPFAGSVTGEVSIGDDSVRVRIDSGVVQNRMPAVTNGATRLDVLEIRAGLASEDSGSWHVDVIGPPALVTAVLAPGESVVIRPTRLAVPRTGGVALDSKWLVFELRANHHGINGRPPGPVTTYICSDQNLVGSPAASAQRAALLKLSYNRAC
jgi:hypothetical protein